MLSVIQDVFRREFDAYARTHRLRLEVHRAARAIASCRTPQRGYHVVGCPEGWHVQRQVNNSCHHRACALCAFLGVERWLRGQVGKLIGCGYHHVILTTPHELNALWRYNRKRFCSLLFLAGWHALRELLAAETYLGALPGAIGSLHTWQQRLLAHVHVHFLVTAGGMCADGAWREAKKKHLLPVRVLQAKFRGKFLAYLRKELHAGNLELPPEMSVQQCATLLNKLGRKKWNAEIRPRYEHGRGVANYLARYVRGGPIAPSRILAYDPSGVTIRLKSSGSGRDPAVAGAQSTFRLSTTEFLSRFITHLAPAGVHVVRSYGLFHHGKADLLARARQIKGGCAGAAESDAKGAGPAGLSVEYCPQCGKPLVILLVVRPAQLGRAPPREAAA